MGTLGWMVWGILFLIVLSLTYGLIRTFIKRAPFSVAVVFQIVTFWILLGLFYVEQNWNKVHLIWIAPIMFFLISFVVTKRALERTPSHRQMTGQELVDNINKNVREEHADETAQKLADGLNRTLPDEEENAGELVAEGLRRRLPEDETSNV